MTNSKNMRFGVDIFSGAGGLSLGAEMAGIRISHAVEINQSAVKTFVRNHKDAQVLQTDVKDIKASDFESKKNPIFVIMGGPPCQGFSMSNTRTRNMENEKNFLFFGGRFYCALSLVVCFSVLCQK